MASWKGAHVIVTGSSGFLGSHLVRFLRERGCEPFLVPHSRYDLRTHHSAVRMFDDASEFFITKVEGREAWHRKERLKPADVVFHLAAHTGGIGLNRRIPGTLFYDNALMGIRMIHASWARGVRKFVQVGTVCAYPKFGPSPNQIKLVEKHLWQGYPEPTNAAYGLAKKMLLVMLQAYRQQYGFNGIYALPTNLFGPGDDFNLETSHVIPATIRKFIEAKGRGIQEVALWGSGRATRDFLYVEDCAEALILLAEEYNDPEPINIGSGREISILALAQIIRNLIGYDGQIAWDTTKPDGQPRRVIDTSRMEREFAWAAKIDLREGLEKTIDWYRVKRESEIIFRSAGDKPKIWPVTQEGVPSV